MNTAFFIAGSALREIPQSVNGIAHNVANINTGFFDSVNYNYQTGLFGTGVDAYLSGPYISDLYEEDSLLFTMNGNYNVSGDKATQDIIFEQEQLESAMHAVDVQRALEQSYIFHSQYASDWLQNEQLALAMNDVYLEREFTSLIADQRAFEANAEFFHAADVMYESLLRMIPAPQQAWEPDPPYEPPSSFVAADVLHANIIEFET